CENSLGSRIIKSTSGFGLFQFSVENAYKVNVFILYFTAARTIFRTTVIPSLCPAIRGSPLFLAHLPLPSIIIAICSGVFSNFIRFIFLRFLRKKGNLIDIVCPPKGLHILFH